MFIQLVTYIMLTFCISCGKDVSPSVTAARSQDQVNKAVLLKLNHYVPHITQMNSGEAQVIAMVDYIHNATRIENDPRQGTLAPEDLVQTVFTDSTMGLICGGFALIVYDTLNALGYETRMVQMFTNGPDNHIANEVKINGKWLAFDATYNVGFKNTNGDYIGYKELKEQVNNGGVLGAVYIGNTHHRLEDNYLPYEPYLANVRALPVGLRNQANLEDVFNGEERF
jgi:hypothetical protein